MSFASPEAPAPLRKALPVRMLPGGSPAVIIGLGAIAVLLFLLTTFVTSAYHRMQERTGSEWFQRGQTDLQAGRPQLAINDFRNALAYARKREYLLKLAQSLAAAGSNQEARGYLLSLWDQQPGSGILNLELARLSARTGQAEDAVRYYQNAIYGLWDQNPPEQRRIVRQELANYLLARGAKTAAEADLIALLPELPKDATSHTTVADLFIAAGNPARAMEQYEQALKLDHNYQPALTGAGQTALASGDYPRARNYLERALRQAPGNTDLAGKLELTELVLTMDPLAPRLSLAERAKRLENAQLGVLSRLKNCAAAHGVDLTTAPAAPTATTDQSTSASTPEDKLTDSYSAMTALKSKLREKNLRSNPDVIEDSMNVIVAAENSVTAVCGPPAGPDLALVLIARMHGTTTP